MKTRIVGLCFLVALSAAAATTNLIPVADTCIHSAFPDNNFGGGETFTSGGRNMGGMSRALLRFDIATNLPANATITAAQLMVEVTAVMGPDSTFDLKRVTSNWGEGNKLDFGEGGLAGGGEASWNNRLGPGVPWASAGGDFVATVSGSQAVAAQGLYTFSGAGLVTDVQMWLNNPGIDFGWALISEAEETAGTIRRFRGYKASTNPPTLAITFTTGNTQPTPPNLFDLARVGNQVRFSFNAQSNRTYAVEFRDGLTNGAWSVLTNIPALSADTTLNVTNAIVGMQRYFRARTP